MKAAVGEQKKMKGGRIQGEDEGGVGEQRQVMINCP